MDLGMVGQGRPPPLAPRPAHPPIGTAPGTSSSGAVRGRPSDQFNGDGRGFAAADAKAGNTRLLPRSSTHAGVVTIRAPVAPIGCPSEQAPPLR